MFTLMLTYFHFGFLSEQPPRRDEAGRREHEPGENPPGPAAAPQHRDAAELLPGPKVRLPGARLRRRGRRVQGKQATFYKVLPANLCARFWATPLPNRVLYACAQGRKAFLPHRAFGAKSLLVCALFVSAPLGKESFTRVYYDTGHPNELILCGQRGDKARAELSATADQTVNPRDLFSDIP